MRIISYGLLHLHTLHVEWLRCCRIQTVGRMALKSFTSRCSVTLLDKMLNVFRELILILVIYYLHVVHSSLQICKLV